MRPRPFNSKQNLTPKKGKNLRITLKIKKMYWEWCLCACREIWSDLRNSSKSVVARQGHGGARFEVIAQTLFMTNGPNA